MNQIAPTFFDASAALRASSGRVSCATDQHMLDIADKERSSVLPWRGQFSPQLVEYFLDKYVNSGNHILDPFCGSGTVVFEGLRAGANVSAIDVNPAAVCLAKLSEIIILDKKIREDCLSKLNHFFEDLISMVQLGEMDLTACDAVNAMKEKFNNPFDIGVMSVFLLQSFGDGKVSDLKKLNKAYKAICKFISSAGHSTGDVNIKSGDARDTGLPQDSIDYIITSPPYINVFNYHQNYRPIIEEIGFSPLRAASSEMGANRKFRQNRYITVVQYCMDMAMFFEEVSRVLSDKGKITIVLGRTSNVRSVAFKNGEMIAAVAAEGMSFSVENWNERRFTNRFGEVIYEDVITMSAGKTLGGDAIEIGRSVGVQSLKDALEYCPIERRSEIASAIDFAHKVAPSPISRGA